MSVHGNFAFALVPEPHPGVRRLLNLAGRQKLLPNSICLSTRPLILRRWKKSSHFRRFSEPVSKFRRPNANRSRLRFLPPLPVLRNPRFPSPSSSSLGYGETKPWEHIVETVFLLLERLVPPSLAPSSESVWRVSEFRRQDKWGTRSVPYDTYECFPEYRTLRQHNTCAFVISIRHVAENH